MKTTAKLITTAAILMAVVSCSGKKVAFTNPVYSKSSADPTAIFNEEDGYYYSTSTGINKPLIRSTNLIEWEETDCKPFPEETINKLLEYGNAIWAPQFAKIDGKYLIYLTVRSSCPDSRIAVVSSDKVTGPYKFEGIVTDGLVTGIRDTIDPFAFVDQTTGKVWLFFGSVDGIHQIELNKDGLSVKEGAQYKHVAGISDQINRTREKVFEGSYVYYRDGWWYLFCSPGRFNDYSYAIAVGRSKTVEGPFLNKKGEDLAEGYKTVILSTTAYEDNFYGPGHNGEIFTDKSGDTYMIYHVHTGGYDSAKKHRPRFMNLQQIYWDAEGWPYFKHEEIEGGTINM